MTEQLLIFWAATTVAAFCGLIGFTGKEAANAGRTNSQAAALARADTRACHAFKCVNSGGVSMPMKAAKSMVVRATMSAIE